MTVAFDKALAFTLDVEGGYSNRASDRGGSTYHGVTQTEYNSWRARHGMQQQPVYLMGDQEQRAIYFEDYWVPCRCEEMPPGLGAAVFDMAVNSGETNAALTLQTAVGAKRDGDIGDFTIAATRNAINPVLRFLEARGAFYRDDLAAHPTDIDNLDGWINRLLRFLDAFHNGAFA